MPLNIFPDICFSEGKNFTWISQKGYWVLVLGKYFRHHCICCSMVEILWNSRKKIYLDYATGFMACIYTTCDLVIKEFKGCLEQCVKPQRWSDRVTKMISGLEHLYCEERLRDLGLFILKKRRFQGAERPFST